MIPLNDKIVAYLTLESISFSSEDFMTGYTASDPDRVLYWNDVTLGTFPNEETLNQYYNTYSNLQQWILVREERNLKLNSSDWTQLSDASIDKNPWIIYRQELRDITLQPDPFNITWPITP